MIFKLPISFLLASSLISSACVNVSASNPSVKWELLSPDIYGTGKSVGRFTVNGLDSISRLCFTQLPRGMRTLSAGDSIVELNAGYYYLTSPKFGTNSPQAIIDVEYTWDINADAEQPVSFHALTPGNRIIPVEASLSPILESSLSNPEWSEWTIAPDSLYRLNEILASGRKPGPFDIAPSFKRVKLTKGTFKSGDKISTVIVKHENPEYYRITLKPGKALIEGASQKAINMAKRTLTRRLLEPNGGTIPCAVIEDWPDYPYRALMIDIARNYQTPETMHTLTELMADYRLNTLHFHITDDEGWRLEIPGLPELTEIGSRRGYTTDSHDRLPHIFSDNPTTADGFFTRRQFIDFIRHCDSIGIQVIPEIESPGHARAAIKAMEARYRNTGDDTYRLIEPGDTSVYTSAQLYHDNLMNPALPSTYSFIAKVVDEVEAMYHEAGVKLPGIHIGGDEVPDGAWDGSTSAMKMAKERGVSGRHGLHGEFVRKVGRIMRDRNIPIFGWQDIYTGYDDEYHTEISPLVGGVNCWVSSLDPEKNVAIKGINSGYPVILSNVDYFYMDMLYMPHPEERGLYWGGFVDELQALSGYPDKLCPPQKDPKGRIIGVSGQLFAETILSKEQMEKLLFPKSLGLAERGWNGTPTYTPADFNILIGDKELPRLERLGVTLHVRAPGIMIKDGKAYINSPYPDAEIHYTLDGSTPTESSPLYTGSLTLHDSEKEIRAAIYKNGYGSVTTLLKR